MQIRKLLGLVGLVSALALTACAGGAGTPETPEASPGLEIENGGETPPVIENGEASPAAENGAAAELLQVQGTDALKFEPETLTAPANQAFTVEFSNPSNLPHNWVLVEPGQEEAVVEAADATGNVPADASGVIATGEVLQGGAASETIDVPTLEAGSYSYICTVPGHYPAGMKGTLNAE
jgi:azurin